MMLLLEIVDKNSYFEVIKPLKAWSLKGHELADPLKKVYDPVYDELTLRDGDEVHFIGAGIFAVIFNAKDDSNKVYNVSFNKPGTYEPSQDTRVAVLEKLLLAKKIKPIASSMQTKVKYKK